MGLQADKERVGGQQQQPDHNWGQNAAWRALWQRLLNPKREELPRHIHNADKDASAVLRKDAR